MITRMRSSWHLLRQSAAVLNGNRRLLLFPLVNGLFTIFLLLFFLAPVVLMPSGHEVTSSEHWQAIRGQLFEESGGEGVSEAEGGAGGEAELHYTPTFMVLAGAVYLVSMFAVTFLNTAFFSEILRALGGERVSLRRGFAFALTRLKPIAAWSLLAGAVGLVLSTIEQYLEFAGRWVAGLLGVAWSVAAVFAIPVIVRDPEATNPFRVLKHSGRLIARRWGEGLIGYVGLRGLSMLVALGLAIGLALLAWAVTATGIEPLFAVLAAAGLWLCAMFAWVCLTGVLERIFQCALYVYAAEGTMPGPFDADAAEAAWRVKRQR